FTIASTLFGLSLFISAACGLPVTWTIVGAGALIVFYCVLGGLWAVVLTDFLQASILIPFCLVLVALSLARVGGLTAFLHSLPAEMKTVHVSGELAGSTFFRGPSWFPSATTPAQSPSPTSPWTSSSL